MNGLETIIPIVIIGFVMLLILGKLVAKKLREHTANTRARAEEIEKELQKTKEMKKHQLGYVPHKEEVFEPSLDEERNEMEGIPSSAVQDEEDEDEEDN
jgi:Mg2+/citrate symporter